VQSILVTVWVILNATAYVRAWDPYPFIFMNLIFSLQSAYTASLILMSQNRQDRLKAHNDYLMNPEEQNGEVGLILSGIMSCGPNHWKERGAFGGASPE
jgi:uncharacterized membrane protein